LLDNASDTQATGEVSGFFLSVQFRVANGDVWRVSFFSLNAIVPFDAATIIGRIYFTPGLASKL